MRGHVFLVLLLVVSVLAPLPANAQGRAMEFNIEVSRFDWLSNETVPMDAVSYTHLTLPTIA